MPLYRTSGHLKATVNDVAAAQAYLTQDDMTQYVAGDEDIAFSDAVLHLEWQLQGNGYDYHIVMFTRRVLTEAELKAMSEWCSGQNSDGLGEGFEQQAFAEIADECGDCWNCRNGYSCEDESSFGMCSFDWETNELPWVKVK